MIEAQKIVEALMPLAIVAGMAFALRVEQRLSRVESRIESIFFTLKRIEGKHRQSGD